MMLFADDAAFHAAADARHAALMRDIDCHDVVAAISAFAAFFISVISPPPLLRLRICRRCRRRRADFRHYMLTPVIISP
jgi:hypothetical protein